jgi:predicted transcriptional regulator of viral defense system
MKTDNPESNLFRIASEQGGYFTAIQAKQAGFSDNNHAYHVRAGNWIREWRGIYRLTRFPLQADAQYCLWGVWSMNRKGIIVGIYSHETALSLYDLSDLQSNKLHLTFPRGYRRHGLVPKGLIIHHAQINPGEYEERGGYRVTKPFRTLVDIIRAGRISPEFTRQSVQQALDRGYMARSQYSTITDMPRIGKRLKKIMGEAS